MGAILLASAERAERSVLAQNSSTISRRMPLGQQNPPWRNRGGLTDARYATVRDRWTGSIRISSRGRLSACCLCRGGNPGEDEDPRIDGANTNRLLRTDVEYDRYTGQPRMGALPVAVIPAPSAAAVH